MPQFAPFPVDPVYTSIALAYRNRAMIADDVLPRVPVGKKEFKWRKFNIAEGFTIPDTKVGRRSAPNQVEFSASEESGFCEDFGLDDPVPYEDMDNAPANYDPRGHAVEMMTNLVELDREVRTASLVFNTASYAASNQMALAGNAQWSDYEKSTPVSDVLDTLDGMVMRSNIMVMGRKIFSRLIRHPEILEAVYGRASTKGIATRDDLARLFELDAVFVGEGFVNTARKGQMPNIARAWGNYVALIYRDSLASADRGTTFGFTAQYGGRIAGEIEDKDIGLRGGVRMRVGESVRELICAKDLGFLFSNVIA
ncbi:MAG: major capsid protein [Betaproteobacteria bacterium]|nr:major capsid protein [Betaproteobacteria bacterium]